MKLAEAGNDQKLFRHTTTLVGSISSIKSDYSGVSKRDTNITYKIYQRSRNPEGTTRRTGTKDRHEGQARRTGTKKQGEGMKQW
jgi:hypothetical protein